MRTIDVNLVIAFFTALLVAWNTRKSHKTEKSTKALARTLRTHRNKPDVGELVSEVADDIKAMKKHEAETWTALRDHMNDDLRHRGRAAEGGH